MFFRICIPEEDLGSNIAILAGLVPGLADEVTVGGAQESGLVQLIVVGNARSSGGGGHSGHGHSRLSKREDK